VKNRQPVASDIDVLVVYQDPKNANDYGKVWRHFQHIPIVEPHVYTLSEYAKLARQKNSWLTNRVENEGLFILGEAHALSVLLLGNFNFE
jgi:predicted nucleotidyltransferase